MLTILSTLKISAVAWNYKPSGKGNHVSTMLSASPGENNKKAKILILIFF